MNRTRETGGKGIRPNLLIHCAGIFKRRGTAVLVAVTVIALAGVPGVCRGNPFDNFGLGSRSAAMAGAMTAVADDFSAALYNPAGLVETGRMEISLGYFYAHPRLETYWADQWWNIGEDDIGRPLTPDIVKKTAAESVPLP